MKRNAKKLFLALFLTVFLNNRLQPVSIDLKVYRHIDSPILQFLYHLVDDLFIQLSTITAVDGLVLVSIFLLLTYLDRVASFRLSKFQIFLSVFFSLGIVLKFSFNLPLEQNDTSYFYLLIENGVQVIKTVCTFISWFIFYNALQRCFEVLLIKFTNQVEPNNWRKIFSDKQEKKSVKKGYFKNLGLILLMWLPSLLIDYPGVLIYDGLTQLFQFHGYAPLRTDHPISSTLFINYSFDFGKLLGSAKLGIFLGVLVQSIILACAFAVIVTVFQILVKKPVFSKMLLLLVGILPIVLSFIPLVTKDIIFSAAFIMFVFCLGYSLFNRRPEKRKLILINMAVWSTIALLFRKNVLYVVILFILYSLILMAFRSNKFVKGITVLALVLSIFAFKGIDLGLAHAYHANTDTLRRESLSIPFQQTARYIKYHGSEMTKAEKKKIDRVLKIDNIATRYNPILSNEVKLYDNEHATNAEMKDYFETWFYEFTQHPVTYFEATIQQNISLISPFDRNGYFTHLDNAYRPGMGDRNQFLVKNKLVSSNAIWSLQEIKVQYFKIFDRLPLLGLLDNPAIYIIGTFFILALSLKFRLRKTIYLLMPSLFLLLTLIAGPIVQGYTRYTAIFPFLFPIFLLAFGTEVKQNEIDLSSKRWDKKLSKND